MAHKAEIIVFLDVAGTARTSIDLIDLCDGDPACPGQPILPYCLKTDWREQIAASIIEDILYDHRALPALKLLLLTHSRFKLFRRRDNGVDDNCNRQSTFKLKLQETIDTGSCFCVAVRLYEHDMLANQLSFRGVMPVNTPPSTLFPLAGPTASPVVLVSADRPTLPAPNKVHVHETLETKRFTTPDIPSLSSLADLQRWYNVLHSRGLVCGVYTPPWKSFTKASHMGTTWSIDCLSSTVMDRVGVRNDIFKGACRFCAHGFLHRW
jgi:hypothetical protein